MAQRNDSDRILAEEGPPGKRLVLKLTHFEESRLLDLRYWYQDKKTSEFRPTGKGLSLTRKNFLCLKETVERRSEEILDWLSISYVPEHVATYEARQAKTNANLELESPAVELETQEEPRDVSFFQVTRVGRDAKITLNTAHPFVKALTEALRSGDGSLLAELLARLLLCHAMAAESLTNSPATHADLLLDQLTHNWSRFLGRAPSGT
jgi:Transcriptional Coactivator p15 (PC4)